MQEDHIYTYVPIGDHYVEMGSLNRYVLHCFQEHEDDIMGWDLLRGCFHDQLTRSRIDRNVPWERADDKALESLMDDNLFLCPVCHLGTTWYPHWHCKKCNRILTLKDISSALNKFRKEKGIQRSINEIRRDTS